MSYNDNEFDKENSQEANNQNESVGSAVNASDAENSKINANTEGFVAANGGLSDESKTEADANIPTHDNTDELSGENFGNVNMPHRAEERHDNDYTQYNPQSQPQYGSPAQRQFGGQPQGQYGGQPQGQYSGQPQGQYGMQSHGQQSRPQSTVGISYDKSHNGEYSWNYSETVKNASARKHAKRRANGLAVFTAIICVAFILTAVALTTVLILNHSDDGLSAIGIEPSETEIANSAENKATAPAVSSKNGETNTEKTAVVQPKIDGANAELSIPQIAEKCKPSAVGIEVSINNGFYMTEGVGSGFIISADGYIATNNHVVENADTIKVLLNDKSEYDATLIGCDSVTDLAVIKIEATDLPVADLGDSDTVKVGELAVAIGTPAGIEFAGTVTDGIISAINRDVEITNSYGQIIKTMTLIQTNATINPGNSGGPLINSKGQVIGINTLKLTSQYEGIGFSIPINSAVKIFNQLIENGEVTDRDGSFVTGQGSIGITQYSEITEREAKYYNIPQGLLVIQISRNSSSSNAGLRRGDIITAFEGEKITTAQEINELKSKYKAGDTVTITVYRDGEGEFDITFKLDIMQA